VGLRRSEGATHILNATPLPEASPMAWRPVERLQTGPATPLAAHIASLTVGGTDRVDLNIAALNSHDGASAFRILVTPVPVVCANTQSAALSNHESSFLYVYVEILHLYLPGVVPDILEGRVWELDINQAWAFGALALMAIPISMIGLSMALPARSNRRANLAVAVVYVVVSVFNAVGESVAPPYRGVWEFRCGQKTGCGRVRRVLAPAPACSFPRCRYCGLTELAPCGHLWRAVVEARRPWGRGEPMLTAARAVHSSVQRDPVTIVPDDLLAAELTGAHVAMVGRSRLRGLSRADANPLFAG
ncbi:MAG: DUF945 domain-containing protein, partial [Actinomycetota bacterium]|nr:DUF945 domain-containing protein [Actinomycetota bacterium]